MTYTIQNPITITDKNDKTFKALAKDLYDTHKACREYEFYMSTHPAKNEWERQDRYNYYQETLEKPRYDAWNAFYEWFYDENGFCSHYPTDWTIFNVGEYKTFQKFFNEFYKRVVEAEIYKINCVDETGEKVEHAVNR